MILISACLLGCKTRYNGSHNLHELLKEYEGKGCFTAVCPECLGGLCIPRLPSEIRGGDGEDVLNGCAAVVSEKGDDLTAEFLMGAEKSLKIVKENNISCAILKERSPSCGVNRIYDGCFSGGKVDGAGVLTALLRRHNIEVFSEEGLSRPFLENLINQ